MLATERICLGGETENKIVLADAPYVINSGDYAKGDGSDETEAIGKAFVLLFLGSRIVSGIRTGKRKGRCIFPRPQSSTNIVDGGR